VRFAAGLALSGGAESARRLSVLRFTICWRIAEAETALAGFPVIEPAHFWIGVCKAVGLRQKTSRHKTQEKRCKSRRKKNGRSVAEAREMAGENPFRKLVISTGKFYSIQGLSVLTSAGKSAVLRVTTVS
jgi:hypothetical protein